MNEVVLLTGIQGSGKSFIASRVCERKTGIDSVDMGTLMFERLAPQLNLAHRDQLRDLPADIMAEAFSASFQYVMGSPISSPLLIVTHIMPNRGHNTYFPQVFQTQGGMSIGGIFMVVTEPATLLERRIRDKHRHRTLANLQQLTDEQRLYCLAAWQTALSLGVPLWIVPNAEGAADHAAAAITTIIYGLNPSN